MTDDLWINSRRHSRSRLKVAYETSKMIKNSDKAAAEQLVYQVQANHYCHALSIPHEQAQFLSRRRQMMSGIN